MPSDVWAEPPVACLPCQGTLRFNVHVVLNGRVSASRRRQLIKTRHSPPTTTPSPTLNRVDFTCCTLPRLCNSSPTIILIRCPSETRDYVTRETTTITMATMGTTTTTPEQAPRSPQRHALAITEAQKQALVDNLQLEGLFILPSPLPAGSRSLDELDTNTPIVTERARKLRAQYALQAHGLKTRLELRVNRIPHSLRTMKMQDLVDKHVQQHLRPTAASSAVPLKHPQHQQHDVVSNMPSPAKRGIKRSRYTHMMMMMFG